MKYLKRLVVLAVVSIALTGCATKIQYVMFPVEKYQFITRAGDILQRDEQEEVALPVDGVWMSMGEKTKLEDAQQFAVEHGFDIQ